MMFNIFGSAKNPDRHFRNVIESNLADYPDLLISKAELEDFNDKTMIKVNIGECAVFVNNAKIMEVIGPSNTEVRVSNYPFFTNFKHALFYGGKRTTTCAVYFMRIGENPTPLMWGTPGLVQFVDPNLMDTRYSMGGNGVFSVCVDRERINDLMTAANMGPNTQFSYENLVSKLEPEITSAFRKAINLYNKEGHNLDSVDQDAIAEQIYPILEQQIFSKFGLRLTQLRINGLTFVDSEERKLVRQGNVARELKKKDAEVDIDIEDVAGRNAIMRKVLEEELIRQAQARGKLAELRTLGDSFWKVRLTELAETALSNPALANIGTTALGGYLGTHHDIVGNLISSLGALAGAPSMPDSTVTTPSAPSTAAGDSSDFWNFIAQEPTTQESIAPTGPKATATQSSLEDEKLAKIELYTDLLIKGKLTQQAYDNLISKL